MSAAEQSVGVSQSRLNSTDYQLKSTHQPDEPEIRGNFRREDRAMQKKWKIISYALCILILLPCAGCAGTLFKNYGSDV